MGEEGSREERGKEGKGRKRRKGREGKYIYRYQLFPPSSFSFGKRIWR